MRRSAPPVFLARQSYRRRRLQDAARLMPLLGAFLFIIPLLAAGSVGSGHWAYLFIAWLGLIVATSVISRGLGRLPSLAEETSQAEQDPEDTILRDENTAPTPSGEPHD